MKEYVDIVRKLIENPRNELRAKALNTKDQELEKILDNYEEAYHRSCLKIEEYIENELRSKDLNHYD